MNAHTEGALAGKAALMAATVAVAVAVAAAAAAAAVAAGAAGAVAVVVCSTTKAGAGARPMAVPVVLIALGLVAAMVIRDPPWIGVGSSGGSSGGGGGGRDPDSGGATGAAAIRLVTAARYAAMASGSTAHADVKATGSGVSGLTPASKCAIRVLTSTRSWAAAKSRPAWHTAAYAMGVENSRGRVNAIKTASDTSVVPCCARTTHCNRPNQVAMLPVTSAWPHCNRVMSSACVPAVHMGHRSANSRWVSVSSNGGCTVTART